METSQEHTSKELKPISGNKRKASSTVVADLVWFNAMQSTNVQIKGVMFLSCLAEMRVHVLFIDNYCTSGVILHEAQPSAIFFYECNNFR